MAAYKKVKQEYYPEERLPNNIQNPDTFNNTNPSWCFRTCDTEYWTFTAEEIMHDILPKLKEWESQTWNEILIRGKKANHSIDTIALNSIALHRLEVLRIEAKSVVSLRLQGTHRLYGYRIGSVFYILWYDKNHGDNYTCVCRSRKK